MSLLAFDQVVTASTSITQAIAACLSKGPFGLGDEVNATNATIVMAAAAVRHPGLKLHHTTLVVLYELVS